MGSSIPMVPLVLGNGDGIYFSTSDIIYIDSPSEYLEKGDEMEEESHKRF